MRSLRQLRRRLRRLPTQQPHRPRRHVLPRVGSAQRGQKLVHRQRRLRHPGQQPQQPPVAAPREHVGVRTRAEAGHDEPRAHRSAVGAQSVAPQVEQLPRRPFRGRAAATLATAYWLQRCRLERLHLSAEAPPHARPQPCIRLHGTAAALAAPSTPRVRRHIVLDYDDPVEVRSLRCAPRRRVRGEARHLSAAHLGARARCVQVVCVCSAHARRAYLPPVVERQLLLLHLRQPRRAPRRCQPAQRRLISLADYLLASPCQQLGGWQQLRGWQLRGQQPKGQ